MVLRFVATIIITVSLYAHQVYATLGQTLRHSAFQVGLNYFHTAVFLRLTSQWWPSLPKIIIFMLYFSGLRRLGGRRLKSIQNNYPDKIQFSRIKRALSPRSVVNVKFEGKPLDPAVITVLMAISCCIRQFLLPLCYWYLLFQAILTVQICTTLRRGVCLNNIGPGFGAIGHMAILRIHRIC